ncbi:MAG: Bax inhibitor-1/YccA family protein [Pseudomonadota bacterium]
MQERAIPQASVAGLSALETSKVLRNTYMLLGMTLAFSALCAGVAAAMNVPPLNFMFFFIAVFGLSFLVSATANSAWGLVSVFVFTGFIGFFTGPILSAVISGLPHGAESVAMAMGTTAFAFIGLSAYALITKKDFSFLSGFIMIGMFAMLGGIILGFFFDLGVFRLVMSTGIVILMASVILWQTSAIVHGGETNYILATTTLFMAIYNMFMSLLHLFLAFGGDD